MIAGVTGAADSVFAALTRDGAMARPSRNGQCLLTEPQRRGSRHAAEGAVERALPFIAGAARDGGQRKRRPAQEPAGAKHLLDAKERAELPPRRPQEELAEPGAGDRKLPRQLANVRRASRDEAADKVSRHLGLYFALRDHPSLVRLPDLHADVWARVRNLPAQLR